MIYILQATYATSGSSHLKKALGLHLSGIDSLHLRLISGLKTEVLKLVPLYVLLNQTEFSYTGIKTNDKVGCFLCCNILNLDSLMASLTLIRKYDFF